MCILYKIITHLAFKPKILENTKNEIKSNEKKNKKSGRRYVNIQTFSDTIYNLFIVTCFICPAYDFSPRSLELAFVFFRSFVFSVQLEEKLLG